MPGAAAAAAATAAVCYANMQVLRCIVQLGTPNALKLAKRLFCLLKLGLPNRGVGNQSVVAAWLVSLCTCKFDTLGMASGAWMDRVGCGWGLRMPSSSLSSTCCPTTGQCLHCLLLSK